MKPAQLNLLLLAVAIGLFALLAFDERQEKAAIAKAIAPQPPLTALDANAIQHIRLRNNGSPDIVLEKTGSGWQLREPVEIAADLVEVGNLTALATLETRGAIDSAIAKRADLGLDPPVSTAVFDERALAIGAIEPLKRTRYIELNPDTPNRSIQQVDDFALQPFDSDYTDLVNKALLPFDATVTALDLPGLRLTRDASRDLWTATPASVDASPEAVQALIDAWRSVRAVATLPALADSTRTSRPDVSIQLADGTRLAFRIIERADARYLQRADLPISYQLLPADAARLLRLQPAAAAPAGDSAR